MARNSGHSAKFMKNTITIRPTALIADAGDSIGKTRTLRCKAMLLT